jgi:pimeloyl-ACP methyl ester carboxylesterase
MKALSLLFVVAAAAAPGAADVRGVAHVPLPVDETGVLAGIEYKIKAPANWNGTLLVYAHETIAFGPPQAQLAPAAWPAEGPTVEERLLAQGYALAGSGYPNDNKQGILATLALTKYFNGRVGIPSRTIVWGNSLGGLISLMLIERHPGIYDGAIANCTPAAGDLGDLDWALTWSLAYSAVFEWREDLWGPIGNLRDDIDFFAEAAPYLQWPDSLENSIKYEFIRLVVGMPTEAFWGYDPSAASPFFGMEAYKALGIRSRLEAEAGGPVAQNVGVTYVLSDDERQYLEMMGLDVVDALDRMNEQTGIMASRPARLYLKHWGEPQGATRRPVLSMHAIFDGLAPVGDEGVYAARVAAQGRSGNLVQAFVNTVGHCSFSADQYLAGVGAMNSWLDTGVRPDATELPEDLGFDLEFEPPEWPWMGSPIGGK